MCISIWPTNREERKGLGKKLYWFKIWYLKDVEEEVPKAYIVSVVISFSDGFQKYKQISTDNWVR